MENPHFRNKDKYKIVQEKQIGYKHLSPKPSLETLKNLYEEDYYDDHYPDWIQKSLNEKDYWLMVYDERYEIFENNLNKNSKRILDIGSFLGFFLEAGKKRNWECLGIEPSNIARKIAIKSEINTKPGFFEDYTINDIGTFDVINLSLTLEHINEPKEMLNTIYSFLNPNGIICIEVPNDFNPLQKAAQDTLNIHEYWIAPPHHINYFNFESLSALLTSTGFNVIDKSSTFPMELFLLMGDNYIGKDEIGKNCHEKRMTLETNLNKSGLKTFKQDLYRFFAEKNIGREAIIYGQKK